VDYVHAVLPKAFNDAVRSDQLLSSNPAERAKRPRREHRGPIEVWSADELRRFLDLMSDHRLFAFYRLAAYSGARRGELLNLRWLDIDWTGPAVRIRGSVGMVAGQRVEGTAEGGRERVVSLDTGTVEVLRAHRRTQLADIEVAGAAWIDTGHVFTNGLGRPIYPNTVNQLMAKSIKAYNDPEDAEAGPPARCHTHDCTRPTPPSPNDAAGGWGAGARRR
jgi:integrase